MIQKEIFEFYHPIVHRTHEMAETSMHSYMSIQADLGDLQEAVLDIIEENPGHNDRQLTELLKLKEIQIERCSVIARRNELLALGYIKCSGIKLDTTTGRPAKTWEARQ